MEFLYLGDHDTAGYHHFQLLKYGCPHSAWASSILMCPSLGYMGLTGEDVYNFHYRITKSQLLIKVKLNNVIVTESNEVQK